MLFAATLSLVAGAMQTRAVLDAHSHLGGTAPSISRVVSDLTDRMARAGRVEQPADMAYFIVN